MLQELTIRDFAIIEKMDVAFQSQMTVLTGETGAGKSIIIDALGLLAGGRGANEYIRKGATKAVIQGLFTLPEKSATLDILADLGIEYSPDELILERDLYRSGRNICRINGIMVNLTTLRRVGETLIDIHGQNEHQELMHPERHLGLLDEYEPQIAVLAEEYRNKYRIFLKQKDLLERMERNEKAWAQRLDMLQFQIDEIEAANLQTDEEERLQEEKVKLDNFQTIHNALEASYQTLTNDEEDVVGKLGVAMDALEEAQEYSPELATIYNKISDAFYNLQDIAHDISGELSDMEWDPNRLDEVEQRLETISMLKRKYGDDIPQILTYYHKIKTELDEMQQAGAESADLKEAYAQAHKEALDMAKKLHVQREHVAHELETEVHRQLQALYMDKAVFAVKFMSSTDLTPNGIDQVEFYIQTNPGENMGPLAKIASGGELSRIMLALKTIFAQHQGVTSIIFDEVDTGVSGRVAQAIAEKISQVAHYSHVLCITHLPQVAAISDHQYHIEKKVINGRTETSIHKLTPAERVDELARMLSGAEVTELTRSHAVELLRMAEEIRQQTRN